MHNIHKRHGDPSLFFMRDFTQQRPVDVATAFHAYRAKRWIEMLQADELSKANAEGTMRQIMDIVQAKKLTAVAVFDYLTEAYSTKNPTLTSEGGTDVTEKI